MSNNHDDESSLLLVRAAASSSGADGSLVCPWRVNGLGSDGKAIIAPEPSHSNPDHLQNSSKKYSPTTKTSNLPPPNSNLQPTPIQNAEIQTRPPRLPARPQKENPRAQGNSNHFAARGPREISLRLCAGGQEYAEYVPEGCEGGVWGGRAVCVSFQLCPIVSR
jgi:hypothetical protein